MHLESTYFISGFTQNFKAFAATKFLNGFVAEKLEGRRAFGSRECEGSAQVIDLNSTIKADEFVVHL